MSIFADLAAAFRAIADKFDQADKDSQPTSQSNVTVVPPPPPTTVNETTVETPTNADGPPFVDTKPAPPVAPGGYEDAPAPANPPGGYETASGSEPATEVTESETPSNDAD